MSYDIETAKINEKYSIKNGIASTVVLNLTNNYFSLFAISVLGATNLQVGYISSLPQFIGMFGSLIGAVVLNRLSEKKMVTGLSIFFTRFFLLLMAFVTFFPSHIQTWLFIAFIGLMNLPGAFANLSWQAFIGDLVLEDRRNHFFSDRNRILTIVAMIATLITGFVLQYFQKSNPLPYQSLFLLGFLFGLIEVYYLMKHKEIQMPIKLAIPKRSTLNFKVFKSKQYLYFIIVALFFNFAWQMAWPLFSIYQIKDAHANGFWISLFSVANQIAQIVSFKWWGKMSDKHGLLKMLFIAALGMGSAPLLTILSTNLIYLTLINLFTGLFLSGTILLLFNQLLNVSPSEDRSSCIGNYNILLSIVGFIAPQIGVLLLETYNMNEAMIISIFMRILGALLFLFLIRVLTPKANKRKLKIYY